LSIREDRLAETGDRHAATYCRMQNVARTVVSRSPEMQQIDHAIRELTLVLDAVPMSCCIAADTLRPLALQPAQQADSATPP
jgi:hypothetical protein